MMSQERLRSKNVLKICTTSGCQCGKLLQSCLPQQPSTM